MSAKHKDKGSIRIHRLTARCFRGWAVASGREPPSRGEHVPVWSSAGPAVGCVPDAAGCWRRNRPWPPRPSGADRWWWHSWSWGFCCSAGLCCWWRPPGWRIVLPMWPTSTLIYSARVGADGGWCSFFTDGCNQTGRWSLLAVEGGKSCGEGNNGMNFNFFLSSRCI